ncbi:Transposase DDE domain protein [Tepidimonas thermarum]|uniref:Transposase DDE domain protein n=1 Tax=Tepidimonas thermarum TaxID=335431 RepID=A0A554X6F0_9BURK|nr:Transposase DDE domain protein [Tepidimonas thermarum]
MDFKGQARCNDTHVSTTDADARLYKKAPGDKSRLCHMGHILMENRNGLIVDVEITHASGTAEREAALVMLGRRSNTNKRITVAADKGYDTKDFIAGCRKIKVTPHVAAKDKHSAIDGRTKRHEGYKTSLKVRKRIEEAFGWIKTVGGLAKTKLIGHAKLAGQALLCFATYNLGSAWAPWAAGGMRIMRECWGTCAQNGQNGLQTGRNARRNRCAATSGRLVSSKAASLVRSKGIFSTAC